ncbi:MAG TPA: TonB family protein [Thiohalobacter sp.]|nr:TonB family protein [Thiohalobacter sp.]
MLHADPILRPRPQAPGRRHRLLVPLLLGSVALHALALAWQPPTPPLRLTAPTGGRSAALDLQLSSAPPRLPEPATQRSAEPAARPPPERATEPVEPPARTAASAMPTAPRTAPETQPRPGTAAPAQRAKPAATVSSDPRPVQTAAPPAPRHPPVAATAAADSLQHSAVLSEIRSALQQHFFYPRLARLRNWEGDVLLGFQLHSDGRIDDIEVLESSGRAVLDQAALNALRSVRQVAYNANHPVELQLPVVYRLQ